MTKSNNSVTFCTLEKILFFAAKRKSVRNQTEFQMELLHVIDPNGKFITGRHKSWHSNLRKGKICFYDALREPISQMTLESTIESVNLRIMNGYFIDTDMIEQINFALFNAILMDMSISGIAKNNLLVKLNSALRTDPSKFLALIFIHVANTITAPGNSLLDEIDDNWLFESSYLGKSTHAEATRLGTI